MVLSRHDPDQASCVERFHRAWRLNNLMRIQQLERATGRFGGELSNVSNLTKSIRLPRGTGASLRHWVSKLPLISDHKISLIECYALQ